MRLKERYSRSCLEEWDFHSNFWIEKRHIILGKLEKSTAFFEKASNKFNARKFSFSSGSPRLKERNSRFKSWNMLLVMPCLLCLVADMICCLAFFENVVVILCWSLLCLVAVSCCLVDVPSCFVVCLVVFLMCLVGVSCCVLLVCALLSSCCLLDLSCWCVCGCNVTRTVPR